MASTQLLEYLLSKETEQTLFNTESAALQIVLNTELQLQMSFDTNRSLDSVPLKHSREDSNKHK